MQEAATLHAQHQLLTALVAEDLGRRKLVLIEADHLEFLREQETADEATQAYAGVSLPWVNFGLHFSSLLIIVNGTRIALLRTLLLKQNRRPGIIFPVWVGTSCPLLTGMVRMMQVMISCWTNKIVSELLFWPISCSLLFYCRLSWQKARLQ